MKESILQQALTRAKQTQSITSERITASRQSIKFDIDPDELKTILTKNYSNEVNSRSKTPVTVSSISKSIKLMTQWLTHPSAKPSLLILGGIGTGKTTLMNATTEAVRYLKGITKDLLNEQGWKLPVADRDREWIKYYSMPDMRVFSAVKLTKDLTLAEKCCSYRGILCIDDLGVEETTVKEYGTAKSPVIDIIYARYDNMLPMVLTTNLDLKGISSKYGERVSDRLIEICDRIVCDGKSHRN